MGAQARKADGIPEDECGWCIEKVIQIIEARKSYQAFRVHLVSYRSTHHIIHTSSAAQGGGGSFRIGNL